MENIKTYIYHQEAINKAIAMLRVVKVEGFEQAQLLSEIGKLICSPIKEDVLEVDELDE